MSSPLGLFLEVKVAAFREDFFNLNTFKLGSFYSLDEGAYLNKPKTSKPSFNNH